MFRILLAISFIAVLACNSGETNQGVADSAGDTPPVSAAGTATDDIEIEKIEVEAIAPKAVAAEVSSCLRLVKTGAFAEALPVCMQAAANDPKNARVQAALAKAQVEAEVEGSIAAAEAAAQAEIDGSIDAAADSASDAAANALGAARD
jgi:hypothetical protein